MASGLISRKALLERLEKIYGTNSIVDKIMLRFLKKLIRKQPTVDAVEVVHGEWIPTKDDNKKQCSKCDVIHLIAQYPYGQANYCPNCGAKMDGGKE